MSFRHEEMEEKVFNSKFYIVCVAEGRVGYLCEENISHPY